MHFKNKNWFTIVELIVVVTLLSIMTSLAYFSINDFKNNSKDAYRISDMEDIKVSFRTFKMQRSIYPTAKNWVNITNKWIPQAVQWNLTSDISLNSENRVPSDPSWMNYLLSTTKNKQYYQVWMTFENSWNPIAYVSWDYDTITPTMFPSLLIASSSTWSIEIHEWEPHADEYRNKFIIDWSNLNLPYDLSSWLPVAKAATFEEAIWTWLSVSTDYWNCNEVFADDKYLWEWEYITLKANRWFISLSQSEIVNSYDSLHCKCENASCINWFDWLVWYWDMDSLSWSKIKDKSTSWNDFSCFEWGYKYDCYSDNWPSLYTWSSLLWWWVKLDWINDFLYIWTWSNLWLNDFTVSSWVKLTWPINDIYYWWIVSRGTWVWYFDNYLLYISKNLYPWARIWFWWTQLREIGWPKIWIDEFHNIALTNYYTWWISYFELYLDWKSVSNSSYAWAPYIDINQKNMIWTYVWGAQYFPWIIDEVKIYNRALSKNEINDYYNWTKFFLTISK